MYMSCIYKCIFIYLYKVYCTRTEEDDSTWTLIQRRSNNATDFQRSWSNYKNTFGDPAINYWLGLDKMHAITRQRQYKLRVDITDWNDVTLKAQYDSFEIMGQELWYQLRYNGYVPPEPGQGTEDCVSFAKAIFC